MKLRLLPEITGVEMQSSSHAAMFFFLFFTSFPLNMYISSTTLSNTLL